MKNNWHQKDDLNKKEQNKDVFLCTYNENEFSFSFNHDLLDEIFP